MQGRYDTRRRSATCKEPKRRTHCAILKLSNSSSSSIKADDHLTTSVPCLVMCQSHVVTDVPFIFQNSNSLVLLPWGSSCLPYVT
jgi:hypothetical protein